MPKSSILMVFVLMLIIVLGAMMIAPRLSELQKLREQLRRLQSDQERQKEEIVFLQKEIDALRRNDSKAVERVARDKFGYSMPGEDIYRIDVQYAGEDDKKNDGE